MLTYNKPIRYIYHWRGRSCSLSCCNGIVQIPVGIILLNARFNYVCPQDESFEHGKCKQKHSAMQETGAKIQFNYELIIMSSN